MMSSAIRLATIIRPLLARVPTGVRSDLPTTRVVMGAVFGNTFSSGVLKDGEDPSQQTNDEWKAKLKPEQYHVTRLKGTEVPWSGIYLDNKQKGLYNCVCCGLALFRSDEKYDSGSGWPSFFDVYKSEEGETNVILDKDVSLGMTRVEVMCKGCKGHLGHVFPDGPKPTGERFCINSASLQFEKEQ